MTSPGKQFREALSGPEIAVKPAVYNALTAKLAALAGYKLAGLGGSTVTNTLLGMADAGFLTLSEMAFMVARTAAAAPIPIMVDADTGYGNASAVGHTVRTLEGAGAGAIMIEDQVSPPRCGHVAGGDVVSTSEMLDKIKAAVDARRDHDFFIIARTDARRVYGLDEAIERGNRYAEAGADGFMADGMLSVEELARVGSEVRGVARITNIGGSSKKRTTPKIPLHQLQDMGYACAAIGLQLLRVGGLTALQTLGELQANDAATLQNLDDAWRRAPLGTWADITKSA